MPSLLQVNIKLNSMRLWQVQEELFCNVNFLFFWKFPFLATPSFLTSFLVGV